MIQEKCKLKEKSRKDTGKIQATRIPIIFLYAK
jgi:hypothetical protein